MENLIDKSFGVHLRILQILGMFPTRRFTKLYTVYTYFMYYIVITPIPILVIINLLLKKHVDIVQISDNAFLTCQMACLSVKLIPFLRNIEAIWKTLDMLEQPLFTTSTQRQEKIINECIKTCKRNCWLFFVFCVLSLISWATKPIVQEGKKLPLEIWVPVDFATNTKVYCFTYIYVVLGN